MRQFILLYAVLSAASILIYGCGSKGEEQKSTETLTQTYKSLDYYTCPMHPSVRRDRPGVCPICHMTLVKVSEVENPGESEDQPRGVHLSASKEILANVSTIQVESKTIVREILLAGKIDYAEPNTQQITTRYGGRIEKLAVSYVGQQVRRGEPVAEIYSPEAITAQREFLVALEPSGQQTGASERSTTDAAGLREKFGAKLRYWGFTDREIDELASTKNVKTLVTVHSPISGTVIRKNVDLQKYVAPGEPLFDVSDLQTIWLQLDVYESDLSAVKIGQTITATIDAFPSEEFRGTVAFIGAVVEPSTRTVRVRATLNNKDQTLKPEMFAQAVLSVPLPKTIVVPSSSVIATGRNSVVWVEVKPNHFEARPVKLGYRAGDFYQVIEGLHEGETVAVSGGYLIDSESQLQIAATGEHKH